MTVTPRAKKPLKLLNFADDIEETEVKWLWYPFIPFGNVTIMFGRGGIGKSHLVSELATQITRGGRLPGQTSDMAPANVLMMSAEDDASAVLKPRLRKAGADLKRIFAPEEVFTLDAAGIRAMEDAMKAMAATVIFIDPIVSYMGGAIDMFRANEVREMMQPLQRAASISGTALIIAAHERKNKDGADADKLMGSADFTNAARSTLYVYKSNDGDRIMANVKNNYAPDGKAIKFSFTEDDTLEWGDWVDIETGEVKRGAPGKQREKAISFLKVLLANGPVPADEVMQMAADEGINKRTLDRAKVGIAESFVKRPGGKIIWYWKLVGDDRQPPEPASTVTLIKAGEVEVV